MTWTSKRKIALTQRTRLPITPCKSSFPLAWKRIMLSSILAQALHPGGSHKERYTNHHLYEHPPEQDSLWSAGYPIEQGYRSQAACSWFASILCTHFWKWYNLSVLGQILIWKLEKSHSNLRVLISNHPSRWLEYHFSHAMVLLLSCQYA